jgi:hypothetical protein
MGVASGYGPVAGFCEHSPEFLGCIKCDGFLEQVNNYHLINWNLLVFVIHIVKGGLEMPHS